MTDRILINQSNAFKNRNINLTHTCWFNIPIGIYFNILPNTILLTAFHIPRERILTFESDFDMGLNQRDPTKSDNPMHIDVLLSHNEIQYTN